MTVPAGFVLAATMEMAGMKVPGAGGFWAEQPLAKENKAIQPIFLTFSAIALTPCH